MKNIIFKYLSFYAFYIVLISNLLISSIGFAELSNCLLQTKSIYETIESTEGGRRGDIDKEKLFSLPFNLDSEHYSFVCHTRKEKSLSREDFLKKAEKLL